MASNGEFIEVLSPSAFSDVQKLAQEIDKVVGKVNDANRAFKVIKMPSEAKHSIQDLSNVQNQQNKLMIESERLIQKISDATKKEALENAKLKVELSNLTKEQKKQAQQALGTLTAYQQLSAELNELRNSAKATAADMLLLEQAGQSNTSVYRNLQKEYDNTSKRVLFLDTNLKRIDANLGQHNRTVGNYATGWNGLSNSINQITREFPAFTYSMQTGLLGLSNNIAPLADEIKNLVAQNKLLQAEGKPTVSVIKQIGSALFSWQTALSVGVTLLTVYGQKLFEWATSAKKAASDIDLLTQATERYQDTFVETTTNAERQNTNLRRLIAVAKDVTKSDEERLKAAQDIKELYPGYLKNLSDEEVMLDANKNQTESYIKAMRQLKKDIQARVEAEAKQGAARENLKIAAELEQEAKVRERTNQQALDLWNKYGEGQEKLTKNERESIQERIKARQELLNEDKEYVSKFGQIYVSETGSVSQIGLYSDTQITELKQRAQALREEFRKQQEETNQVIQETSLLDFKPDTEKQKKLQTELAKDFLASQYALIQLRLENEASANERTFNDERTNYKKREEAFAAYLSNKEQLSENALKEDLRVIKLTSDNEIAELRKRAKEGEITEKNANNVIYSIQKQAQFDSLKAYEEYYERQRQIDIARAESMRGVWDNINFQKAENIIDQRSLDAIMQYNSTVSELIKNQGDYQDMDKAARKYKEAIRDITKANIQVEIDRIETEKRGLKDTEANVRRRLELDNMLINKREELAKVEKEEIDEQAAAIKNLQQATENHLQAISKQKMGDFGFGSLSTLFDEVTYEIVNDLGQIETKTASTFQMLSDGANTAAEKFAVGFNLITSVAQEAFAFLQQNQQAYFDAQYSNLEREKELALRYAGESAEGRENVERQFEERRREIRRREAEAQKEQAIFNAVINVAQGVTAALAQGPSGIPLSVVIGLLGAAQIALISARQIPQYKEGTANHPGGWMIVNDAPGNVYQELVKEPGKAPYIPEGRNALVNAPKGTKVLNARDTMRELDGIFANNGINSSYPLHAINQMPKVEISQSGGLTKSEMKAVMRETISKIQVNNVNIDRDGMDVYTMNQSGRNTHLNDRKTFRGKGV